MGFNSRLHQKLIGVLVWWQRTIIKSGRHRLKLQKKKYHTTPSKKSKNKINHINFWSMGQANSLGFWASLVGQVHTHWQKNQPTVKSIGLVGYPRVSIVLGWVVGYELSSDIFVREMLHVCDTLDTFFLRKTLRFKTKKINITSQ